jgi:beta-lactamase superfamily II metal-dependent hydrolase
MFITGVNYNLLEYGHFMSVIKDYPNINLVYITQPKKYFLCGITITILAPVKTQFAQDVKNINDSSIVLLFEFLDQKILITGDAEHHQEAEILAAYPNLPKVNILKAGHHGSRTSTTEPFLDAINPDKIVISAGKDNSYSHPHPETIQKANQRQIEIFRTDQQSDIRFFFE